MLSTFGLLVALTALCSAPVSASADPIVFVSPHRHEEDAKAAPAVAMRKPAVAPAAPVATRHEVPKAAAESFRFKRATVEKVAARKLLTEMRAHEAAAASSTASSKASAKASSTAAVARAAAQAGGSLNASCVQVHPTFCTMVDWPVEKSRVPDANVEQMIMYQYYSIQGPTECRKEFKQLFCRQNYPKCASDAQYPSDLVVTPCRTSCQAFAKRCPGANTQCNDFSQDGNCQDYKYMTERAYMTAHAWTGATNLNG